MHAILLCTLLILGGTKMKKILLSVLSVLLLFLLASCGIKSTCNQCGEQCDATKNYCSNCGAALSGSVDENEKGSEGLQYHLKSDGTYSVAWGTTNLLDKIVIPKTYNGKPVTEIETRGIVSPWKAKEVVIPNTITTISERAFAYFQYLTDFVVPEQIVSIGAGAFHGCVNLKAITLPNTIKTIEARTFQFCISLEEIFLPDSIEEIKYEAFVNCYQLASITIPDSVKAIDNTAFNSCGRLVEIINYSNLNFDNYFNKRIVHQGESLIKNVDGFKFITIDNTNYLISYVGGDEKITLPKYYNNSTYELLPYYSLAYLTNFGYPSSINVTEVVIPETITVISPALFHETRNLIKITLPKTITSIGEDFGRETGISDIYYLGTKEEWEKVTLEEGWKYDIGNAIIHCTDGDLS